MRTSLPPRPKAGAAATTAAAAAATASAKRGRSRRPGRAKLTSSQSGSSGGCLRLANRSPSSSTATARHSFRQCLVQRHPRLVEGRRDRSFADADDVGNLWVGEVGEVAQKDNKPPARWERSERGRKHRVARWLDKTGVEPAVEIGIGEFPP